MQISTQSLGTVKTSTVLDKGFFLVNMLRFFLFFFFQLCVQRFSLSVRARTTVLLSIPQRYLYNSQLLLAMAYVLRVFLFDVSLLMTHIHTLAYMCTFVFDTLCALALCLCLFFSLFSSEGK